ncbi:cell division protein FtsW [Bacteroidia bacterium]|nr:cell division protein FtsW [Bacteroidia bacterium]
MFNFKDKVILKGDKTIWYLVIALMIVSILVVYSSTGRLAFRQRGGNTSYYLMKQTVVMLGCIITMLFLQSVHYKHFLTWSKLALVLAYGAMIWSIMSGSNLGGGGDRWVRVPVIGFSFQPSEVVKLAVIMYSARMIAFAQTEKNCSDDALYKIMWRAGPLILAVFMQNFSTSVLLAVVCFIMLFIGRLRLKLILSMMGVAVGTFLLLITLLFTFPSALEIGRLGTIKHRMEAFIGHDPIHKKAVEVDQEGYSYQSEQAKIAVAKGGLLPNGPGTSEQRNVLPEPYSDFIFAIIVEEYGLFGGFIILALYLILLFRIGVIVHQCTRVFPAVLVVGLGISISLQAFVNMAVCVGLTPVTGQPLPLVSMGGTSLVFTSIALGMILSISNTFTEERLAEAAAVAEAKAEAEKILPTDSDTENENKEESNY